MSFIRRGCSLSLFQAVNTWDNLSVPGKIWKHGCVPRWGHVTTGSAH